MKKERLSRILKKMLTTFMTFAFFYLVIGDLIIIHQRAFSHTDIPSSQPFSKPNKTEHYYKVKDKKDKLIISLVTFVSCLNVIHVNQLAFTGVTINFDSDFSFIKYYQNTSINYRGPPVLL